MKRGAGHKGQSFNILFTMLLFLVFVLCALFTVLIGGKVYENISARMEDNYTGSVALGYVANKVRQGDQEGFVKVVMIEDTPVLELTQQFESGTYVTRIYHKDGSVRELFTDAQSDLTLADGLPIIECDGLNLEQNGNMLKIETAGPGGSTLWLKIRSGGQADE